MISDVSICGDSIALPTPPPTILPGNWGSNLLANADFSNGSTAWAGLSGAALTVQPGQGYTGGNALYVGAKDAAWYTKGLQQAGISLSGGSNLPAGTYKLAFWAKPYFNSSTSTSGSDKRIGCELMGSNYYGFLWFTVTQNSQWVYCQDTFTIASGDNTSGFKLNIFPYENGSTTFGDFLISDVSICGDGIAMSAPSTPPPTPIAGNWGQNLLINGGLTTGSAGWYGGQCAVLTIHNGQGYTGGNALYVSTRNTVNYTSSLSQNNITMPDGRSNLPAGIYKLAFWVKPSFNSSSYTAGDNTRIGCELMGSSYYGFQWFQVTQSGQWLYCQGTYTIAGGDNTSGLKLNIFPYGAANTFGDFLISDISLCGDGIAMPISTAGMVNIAAGASIQAAIDANPAGTSFKLAAGTWYGQNFNAKNNDKFFGDPNGGTVLDGNGIQQMCTNGIDYGITGVTLQNLNIKNYNAVNIQAGENCAPMVNTNTDWSVINCTFSGSGGSGLYIHRDNVTVVGGRTYNNAHAGIEAGGSVVHNCIIKGLEIDHNNTRGDDPGNDASGLKMCGAQTTQILDCYAHDNNSSGIWFDIESGDITIDSNNIVNNLVNGVHYEVSFGGSSVIRNNTISGNGQGQNAPIDFGIYISSSSNCSIYNNVVTVPNTGANGIVWQSDTRPDNAGNVSGTGTLSNVYAYNNMVIFQGTGGQNGVFISSTIPCVNGSFYNNTYYSPNGAIDHHFTWNLIGSPVTLSSLQASYGQESGSTVNSGSPTLG